MRGVIYKYTNTINGKVYIGQTINEVKRKSSHKRMASEWKSYFYNAIAKYGYDSFDYEVIYEVTSDIPGYVKTVLDMMETYFIAKYKSTDRRYGYNITAGGGGAVGVSCSEEHKRKISAIMKNKHIVQTENQRRASLENFKKIERHGNPKVICQYSLTGEFIKEFPSYKDASSSIGGSKEAFANAVRNGMHKGYYKGFYWIPKNSEMPIFDGKDPKASKIGDPILQYDKDNNLLHIWKSCYEVARAYNKAESTTRRGIQKHPTNYLGYRWEILSNCSKQEKYDLFYKK